MRAAKRLEPDYQLLLDDLRTSPQITADETGWRIGGRPAWLHAWVGDRAVAYGIDSQRSAAVLERVIGWDWDGVLSHDGFASYQRFSEAVHQQCTAHVLRRARDMLETATRGAVRFPRQVIALFTEAIHEGNRFLRGETSLQALQALRDEFDDRLLALARPTRSPAEYERLAKHLWNHSEQWFAFVSDPTIEATTGFFSHTFRSSGIVKTTGLSERFRRRDGRKAALVRAHLPVIAAERRVVLHHRPVRRDCPKVWHASKVIAEGRHR